MKKASHVWTGFSQFEIVLTESSQFRIAAYSRNRETPWHDRFYLWYGRILTECEKGCQQIVQILVRIQIVSVCCFYDGTNNGTCFCPFFCITEQEILTADDKWLHSSFSDIIRNMNADLKVSLWTCFLLLPFDMDLFPWTGIGYFLGADFSPITTANQFSSADLFPWTGKICWLISEYRHLKIGVSKAEFCPLWHQYRNIEARWSRTFAVTSK